MLRDKIIKMYQFEVDSNLSLPEDLKKSLKTHERVPSFIDNLAREIPKVDALRVLKGKKSLTEDDIKFLVASMTSSFIMLVKAKYDEMYETEFSKHIKISKANEQKEIADTADGKDTSLKHDLGIIEMTDERSVL